MDLLTEYEIAQRTLKSLEEQEKHAIHLVKNITQSYEDRIRILKDEMSEAISKAQNQRDKIVEQIKTKKYSQEQIIKKVQYTLSLINLIMDNPQKVTPEVYIYSDKDEQGNRLPGWNEKREVYIDPIKTILDNEYSIMNLYIVPNQKPKNKYSLIIRGYSIFSGILNQLKWGSISRVNENSCNIYLTIKDAASEKELLSYVDKYMNKIMSLIPDNFQDIEKDYIETKELLKDPAWQIMYYEGRKHYYEEHYSHGTETEEYKEVLKQLRKLKSN